MGWYDRIQSVQVSSKGAKLGPGNYVLHVQEVKEHRGHQGGAFFIAEFKVLQSDNAAHPIGQEVAQVIKLDGPYPDQAVADVKAFASACVGLDPNDSARVNAEVTPDVVAGLLHPTQPARGAVLGATVWMKQPGARSKPGAQPFAKFSWRPMLDANGRPVVQPLPALPPRQPQAAPVNGPVLPYHPQAAAMGQGYVPNMAPPPAQAAPPVQGPPPLPAAGPPPLPAAGPPPWAPPEAPAFPPAGWAVHPQDASRFWKGSVVLTEPELRAAMAAGRA